MSSTLTQLTASRIVANQAAAAPDATERQAGPEPTAHQAAMHHAAAPESAAGLAPEPVIQSNSVSFRPLNLPAKAPPPLVWRSWPLVDEGTQHWPVLGVTIAFAAICGLVMASIAIFAVVLAVQWLALWRLLLPVEYELNEREIRQTVLGRSTRVAWSAIRRCQILPEGLFLSPDAQRRPFARWRGRFIPWGEHRADILAVINKHAAESRAT
jgi:hypothetical protein